MCLPFVSHESNGGAVGGNNFPRTADSSSFITELYVVSISGTSVLVTLNRSGILAQTHSLRYLKLSAHSKLIWKHLHRVSIVFGFLVNVTFNSISKHFLFLSIQRKYFTEKFSPPVFTFIVRLK